jgi:hypothetical protein
MHVCVKSLWRKSQHHEGVEEFTGKIASPVPIWSCSAKFLIMEYLMGTNRSYSLQREQGIADSQNREVRGITALATPRRA